MGTLSSMRYKDFIWTYNPKTCKYSATRSYAKHKYPELCGSELEDMDPDAVVITGEGEFSGTDAYARWTALQAVFAKHGVGEFYHPVFTDVHLALMTKLDASMEPRDDYVAYSFEFVSGDVIQPVKTMLQVPNTGSSATSVADNTGRTIVVGDVVICNGYAYYTSYGANPHTSLLTNKSEVVTHVNYKGTHPICVGSLGWMKLSDVKLGNTAATAPSTNTKGTYTVHAGDTLWAIGKKYGIPWKNIASVNNIKNPNLIYPGTVLKIPTA